jgi:hypothetical protein
MVAVNPRTLAVEIEAENGLGTVGFAGRIYRITTSSLLFLPDQAMSTGILASAAGATQLTTVAYTISWPPHTRLFPLFLPDQAGMRKSLLMRV